MTAITMWVNIIVPSVFPYTIISQYISDSQIVQKLPGRFISFIFGIHGCSIKAIISSVFCGYPSGAVCAKNLYIKNEIDIDEASHLICFTNNAGPLFLISAVGTGLLGNTRDGAMIYLIQLISSFIYGIFTRKNIKEASLQSTIAGPGKGDFCSYVKNGVSICINICGFMVMAYVMASVICIIAGGIIKQEASLLFIEKLSKSFFEVSAGVKELSTMASEKLRFALICSAVSWSGFSVIMQIKSVAGEIIGFKKLIYAKSFQAVCSFFLGYGYKSLYTQSFYSPKGLTAIPASVVIGAIIIMIYLIKERKLSEKI
ncbi:MAG: hypothetical protein IJN40_00335 [Clostridia bacterium]|nr:hypothetical protein [Clostridia bacterium]